MVACGGVLRFSIFLVWACSNAGLCSDPQPKADGYRGIWYMNQPSNDEYVYKYSGGLGTYCAKHNPFAIHVPEANKTFFCYGGTTLNSHRRLVHMVSYFDHATGQVPRPTLLLDKETDDAHDNPVISVDAAGHIWVFSTSHGTSRPSFIHKSLRPYDIDEFIPVAASKGEGDSKQWIDNFSYMQAWHVPERGFLNFFTKYNYPVERSICYMTSADGVNWSEWKRIAIFGKGHYQISAIGSGKAGSAFNYHPVPKGLNWRSNLYFVETADHGGTWHSADGKPLKLPLEHPSNPALVFDSESLGLNVYLKDIQYDAAGRPIILFITSKGYESGPKNDPRTWRTAGWNGDSWDIRNAMTSDNNYDMGSLYVENDGVWRIIAPTQPGPQPYNPGGEMAMWISRDEGAHWRLSRQLTRNSPRNHSYARRPVNAHPDFYAFWADGHGRQPSISNLYFCNREGKVFVLPRKIKGEFATPKNVFDPPSILH